MDTIQTKLSQGILSIVKKSRASSAINLFKINSSQSQSAEFNTDQSDAKTFEFDTFNLNPVMN